MNSIFVIKLFRFIFILSLTLIPKLLWSSSKYLEIKHLRDEQIIDYSITSQFFAQNLTKKNNLLRIQDAGMVPLPFLSTLIPLHPDQFSVKVELGEIKKISPYQLTANKMKPCRCHQHPSHRSHMLSEKKLNPLHQPYSLEFLGHFQGQPISRIVFHPYLYDEKNLTLTLYQGLKLSLHYQKSSFPTKINFSSKEKNLIIIAPQMFASSLEPLLRWKRKIGFNVQLYSLEEMGKTSDEIKENLKKIYLNPSTQFQYALLVGHEESFPTHYVKTTTNPETPSDLPYFLMDGEDDKIPDVYYGRLVVDQEEELKYQIKKVMDYEKAQLDEEESLALFRGIGIASNEGDYPSDQEYLKRIEAPFIEHFPQWQFKNFFQGEETSKPLYVNETLNQGLTWLIYLGHGSGYSWDSMTEAYNQHDLKNLVNEKVIKPIIIDVSCQNGRFLYDQRLGERFLNETSHSFSSLQKTIGAVGYYGGSVDITWDPPAIMAQGISQASFNQRFSSLGEVLLQGQMSLYTNYYGTESIFENFVWYHLLGDPTLMIKLGKEFKIKTNKKDHFLYFRSTQGKELKNINITFHNNEGLYRPYQTDEDGKIDLKTIDRGLTHFSILIKGHQYLEQAIE